jgi:hypothetical protein
MFQFGNFGYEVGSPEEQVMLELYAFYTQNVKGKRISKSMFGIAFFRWLRHINYSFERIVDTIYEPVTIDIEYTLV